MSSSRPKLKLDEQSFQDMLAAAFTIQEHNAKRKRATLPERVCEQCGAPVKEEALLCGRCAGEELRPGEQLQRKWASLWLMSQEQGLWPDHPAQERTEGPDKTSAAEIQAMSFPDTLKISDPEHENVNLGDFPEATEVAEPAEQDAGLVAEGTQREPPSTALASLKPATPVPQLIPDFEFPLPESSGDEAAASWNLRNLRLRLRFHRADLYLVVAIVVSTFAMIWVLSATPAAGAAQRKPRLRPWERALVSLGLADAPEQTPRRGNPNIQVWVDPKTALYYCVGEELYGKAPEGHATTQREAQMDQFEPAGRAACE